MKLVFKTPQEGMPEEHEPVIIYFEQLERRESENDVDWAIGYYDGSKWCFDVPRDVFAQLARYNGIQIPSGEDIVAVRFRRVTYWARLPKHPIWREINLAEAPENPPPTVRYNRAENIVEIFGGSSAHTKENPYYLEFERFASPAAALKSMAHIAGKTWASEVFMDRLASVLIEAMSACDGGGSRLAN